MMFKRYQYHSKEGVVWTEWFKFRGEQEEIQLGKLRNEYKKV